VKRTNDRARAAVCGLIAEARVGPFPIEVPVKYADEYDA